MIPLFVSQTPHAGVQHHNIHQNAFEPLRVSIPQRHPRRANPRSELKFRVPAEGSAPAKRQSSGLPTTPSRERHRPRDSSRAFTAESVRLLRRNVQSACLGSDRRYRNGPRNPALTAKQPDASVDRRRISDKTLPDADLGTALEMRACSHHSLHRRPDRDAEATASHCPPHSSA